MLRTCKESCGGCISYYLENPPEYQIIGNAANKTAEKVQTWDGLRLCYAMPRCAVSCRVVSCRARVLHMCMMPAQLCLLRSMKSLQPQKAVYSWTLCWQGPYGTRTSSS